MVPRVERDLDAFDRGWWEMLKERDAWKGLGEKLGRNRLKKNCRPHQFGKTFTRSKRQQLKKFSLILLIDYGFDFGRIEEQKGHGETIKVS